MTTFNENETFHCRHCNSEIFSGNMFCDDCEREIDDFPEDEDDEDEE